MPTTIRVKPRGQPAKKFAQVPDSVDVELETTTVDGLKKLLAKAGGVSDHNRFGLYNPATQQLLKDHTARLATIEGLADHGEVLLKDLGPQIDWRSVFVLEYFGPLFFHIAVVALRPYLYERGNEPMSATQWLAFAMFIFHFGKREVETLFVHRFSAHTMPMRNVFRNCFFYWSLAGLFSALRIYHPASAAAKANQPYFDLACLAVFLVGQVCNALVHLHLASLRRPGTTERKIPTGLGFQWVTCPNYLFEVVAWVGMMVGSRSWAPVTFFVFGFEKMVQWGRAKEAAYRRDFGDKYKKKRYVVIPGLV